MKPMHSDFEALLWLLENLVIMQESCGVLQHGLSNGNETSEWNLGLSDICESFSIDFN